MGVITLGCEGVGSVKLVQLNTVMYNLVLQTLRNIFKALATTSF
jgi:hypothetical protein